MSACFWLFSMSLAFLVACSGQSRFSVEQNLSQSAVIGGEEAKADDPLTLTVVALRDKDTRDNVCTGTLLSRRLVLTAAHCVEDYMKNNAGLEIVLGPSSWEVNQGEVFVAEKIVAHPWYFEKSRRQESNRIAQRCGGGGCSIAALASIDQGDLAVIRLKGQVSTTMVPVVLNRKRSAIPNGASGLIAGFGQHSLEDSIDTGFLRFFQAPVYRHFEGTDLTPFRKLMIPSTLETGSCFGDSGGPIFMQLHGRRVQVGIAQAALQVDPKKEFACGFKSMGYTDVSAYLSWIRDTQRRLEGRP